MTLTVGQLLADPDAAPGRRDRRASATSGSSRPRTSPSSPLPGAWLQGGELLMTVGLQVAGDPRGQRAWVAEAAGAGVAALAVGLGSELPFQEAPAAMVAAAREHGVPLLAVPDDVPFIAVTKAVFAARAAAERAGLEEAVTQHRALTAAAAGERGPRRGCSRCGPGAPCRRPCSTRPAGCSPGRARTPSLLAAAAGPLADGAAGAGAAAPAPRWARPPARCGCSRWAPAGCAACSPSRGPVTAPTGWSCRGWSRCSRWSSSGGTCSAPTVAGSGRAPCGGSWPPG